MLLTWQLQVLLEQLDPYPFFISNNIREHKFWRMVVTSVGQLLEADQTPTLYQGGS
jgi:hypothetical protein